MNGIIGLNTNLVVAVMSCLACRGEKARVIAQAGSDTARVCRRSRYCAGVLELDLKSIFASPSTALGPIQDACNQLGIKFLIPSDMASSYLLADIRDGLKGIALFPISNSNQLRELFNKMHFARLLDRLGHLQPKFWELNTEDQITNASWTYPVVLKPLDFEGGHGVKVCANPQEARSHFRTLLTLGSLPFLVQEYIPGSDLDLSVLAEKGKTIAWSMHQAWRPPGGPMIYRLVENPGFLESGTRLMQELGYTGLIHIDGRLDERDGTVKMIEANPRVYASLHYTALAGVNFISAALDVSRGLPVPAMKQDDGLLHSPFGSLYVLTHPSLKLPFNTPSTRRAWAQFLRDPLPFALGFLDRKRVRDSERLHASCNEHRERVNKACS